MFLCGILTGICFSTFRSAMRMKKNEIIYCFYFCFLLKYVDNAFVVHIDAYLDWEWFQHFDWNGTINWNLYWVVDNLFNWVGFWDVHWHLNIKM